MDELSRISLTAPINEASGMAAISKHAVLRDLDADEAWYVVHDEGGLDTMVSVIIRRGDDFSIEPLEISSVHESTNTMPTLTDAEAIAIDGEAVLVIGSSFVGPKGSLDERRSFIVKLEHERELDAIATTIEFGTALTEAINQAINVAAFETLTPSKSIAKRMPEPIDSPVNIEGAVVIGDDLLLGLRWPSTTAGQPLLATVHNHRALFSHNPTPDTPTGLDTPELTVSVVAIQGVGSAKKPAGFRALSMSDATQAHPGRDTLPIIDAIVGPTDRRIAAKNVRAAPLEHVRFSVAGASTTEAVATFEGYRKVEALAPTIDGGWIYGLDDDDAIILLTSP